MKYTFTLLMSFWLVATQAQDRRYEEWYLRTTDSIDLYVKEWHGGLDTVIVIHGGFGANHAYMEDAVAGLEGKYHFVFYDQRGSLLSPAPVHKLTFDQNVQDLHALVTQMRLKKVKLLCHSMGALVGMEFARLYPDKVDVLVVAGGLPPTATGYASVFNRRVQEDLSFLATRPELQAIRAPYVQKGNQLSDKERSELWRISYAESQLYDLRRWRLVKGGKIFYNEQAAVMDETINWNYDYRPYLDEVNTTYLIGEYDFLDFSGDRTGTLIKDYLRLNLKVIPDAGHTAWIDQPELFQTNLHKALQKKIEKPENLTARRRRP